MNTEEVGKKWQNEKKERMKEKCFPGIILHDLPLGRFHFNPVLVFES